MHYSLVFTFGLPLEFGVADLGLSFKFQGLGLWVRVLSPRSHVQSVNMLLPIWMRLMCRPEIQGLGQGFRVSTGALSGE